MKSMAKKSSLKDDGQMKQNTFSLKIEKVTTPDGPLDKIVIYIDGVNLLTMVKEFETPLAQKEGNPNIAGSYAGLAAGYYGENYFLADCCTEYGINKDKLALLECTCGYAGCWPFAAKITVNGDTVTWSDFEQPHRQWDYSTLGPFGFEREAYTKELAKLDSYMLKKTDQRAKRRAAPCDQKGLAYTSNNG